KALPVQLGAIVIGESTAGVPRPKLIGTPRKRTISTREVDHGQGHDYWKAAGRRGAATRVRRSGAGPIRSIPSSLAATVRHTAAAAARTNWRDVRRCADGGDPCRAGRQPVPWRTPAQGLGTLHCAIRSSLRRVLRLYTARSPRRCRIEYRYT